MSENRKKMIMIDYTELGNDGETWELFARDFFVNLGYSIECPPDRGADGGKDLIVAESLKGPISSYKYRWLVSCKNFSQSGKAVSPRDEPSISDRCQGFGVEGFIGFYSTVASSGLNTRLLQLKEQKKLKDYKIFDKKSIENFIVTRGRAHLRFVQPV